MRLLYMRKWFSTFTTLTNLLQNFIGKKGRICRTKKSRLSKKSCLTRSICFRKIFKDEIKSFLSKFLKLKIIFIDFARKIKYSFTLSLLYFHRILLRSLSDERLWAWCNRIKKKKILLFRITSIKIFHFFNYISKVHILMAKFCFHDQCRKPSRLE